MIQWLDFLFLIFYFTLIKQYVLVKLNLKKKRFNHFYTDKIKEKYFVLETAS